MADFDDYAVSYDTVLNKSLSLGGESATYFTDYKADFFHSLTTEFGPGPVLDFGCGIGNLLEAIQLRQPATRIDGFDVSSDSLEQLRLRAKSRGFARDGLFTDNLDEVRPPYRYIVISNVMHHVLPVETRPGLVKRLASLLAPGGRLVVFEHNPLNPATRWTVAHCAFDDDAVLVWPGRLDEMMRAAGLGKLDRRYIVFFPKMLSALRGLEPRLGWLPMGAQYCAMGVKA